MMFRRTGFCVPITLSALVLLGISAAMPVVPAVAEDASVPGLKNNAAQSSSAGKALEANPDAPRLMWYYDYRTSEKLCLTDKEAIRRQLSTRLAMAECKPSDRKRVHR